MTQLSFRAAGIPQPQGSKTRTRYGMREDNADALRPWRDTIIWEARHARAGTLQGPVEVELLFSFPRTAQHYRSGRYAGQVKDTAPTFKSSRPDVDKLARAVLDALTIARVIRDDGQVASLLARKTYVGEPGVQITVRTLGARTSVAFLTTAEDLVDELYAERYA